MVKGSLVKLNIN